jgi:hypothetical protein
MFLAYLEQQNIEYVRNKCGVSWHTAKKYIEHGDPDRAVESFRARLKRVSKMTQRTFEERVAFAKGVGMANLWEQVADLDDVIELALEKLKATIGDPKTSVRITDVVKAIDLSSNIKIRLAKQVEQTRTVTETTTMAAQQATYEPTEEDIARFSPRELQAFIDSDGAELPSWIMDGSSPSLNALPSNTTEQLTQDSNDTQTSPPLPGASGASVKPKRAPARKAKRKKPAKKRKSQPTERPRDVEPEELHDEPEHAEADEFIVGPYVEHGHGYESGYESDYEGEYDDELDDQEADLRAHGDVQRRGIASPAAQSADTSGGAPAAAKMPQSELVGLFPTWEPQG